MKRFLNFDEAFSYTREKNHPVIVFVRNERWKLFPSGSAKLLGLREPKKRGGDKQ